jgi:Mg2+ and Co2+ transporter CorA
MNVSMNKADRDTLFIGAMLTIIIVLLAAWWVL